MTYHITLVEKNNESKCVSVMEFTKALDDVELCWKIKNEDRLVVKVGEFCLVFFCSGNMILFYYDEQVDFRKVSKLSEYLRLNSTFNWLGEHGESYNLSGTLIKQEEIPYSDDLIYRVKSFIKRNAVSFFIILSIGVLALLVEVY